MSWDFTKLPVDEYDNVIQLVEANDTTALVVIHNKYGLSSYDYCCSVQGVLQYFTDAINNGTITSQSN